MSTKEQSKLKKNQHRILESCTSLVLVCYVAVSYIETAQFVAAFCELQKHHFISLGKLANPLFMYSLNYHERYIVYEQDLSYSQPYIKRPKMETIYLRTKMTCLRINLDLLRPF